MQTLALPLDYAASMELRGEESWRSRKGDSSRERAEKPSPCKSTDQRLLTSWRLLLGLLLRESGSHLEFADVCVARKDLDP